MHFLMLSPWIVLTAVLALFSGVSAEQLIETSSLNTCQDNSSFTASLFNVVFTPANLTVTFDIIGLSSITGNVTFDVEVFAYGYSIVRKTVDPCSTDLDGLCPMNNGQFGLPGNAAIDKSVADIIPSIAYGVPDLDARVKVQIYSASNHNVSLACLEARLSNGQTVDQKGVAWTTAIVAGLSLAVSAVISGLGHSNTAAHIASYALSLFSYFQAIAIIGMTAVPQPPIVQAWTQNFQWSMGIIKVGFLQNLATWYLKSTGGTPATVLNTLTTTSVEVVKRSMSMPSKLLGAGYSEILGRSNNQNAISALTGTYTVKGINRVAFRANMEASNLFFTGIIFFCVFVILVVIGVSLFKGFCELAIRSNWMSVDKFVDFRNGWLLILKGIMFRLVLIGYPQMTILCLWEFTQVDSPAEVVIAVFFFAGMSFTLGFATFKVIKAAKHSTDMHKTPAYILYSDPSTLNKWGFLYVQYKATAYYFILPMLCYIITKGAFIALAQGNGGAQGIALVIIEAIALIGASIVRPWMDKKTNTVNIAIAAVNFVNGIIVLILSNIFDLPPLGAGITGVIFFVFNAVFALTLLIMVIVATTLSLVRKNPDMKYQPLNDNRASFIKSQTQFSSELDALGATARGGMSEHKHPLDLDDDNDSLTSEAVRRQEATKLSLPLSNANAMNPPHSPVDLSVPLLPHSSSRSASPSANNPSRGVYQGAYGAQSHPANVPFLNSGVRSASESSVSHEWSNLSLSNAPQNRGYREANNASPAGFRSQNNASPWQRGAGYDH